MVCSKEFLWEDPRLARTADVSRPVGTGRGAERWAWMWSENEVPAGEGRAMPEECSVGGAKANFLLIGERFGGCVERESASDSRDPPKVVRN